MHVFKLIFRDDSVFELIWCYAIITEFIHSVLLKLYAMLIVIYFFFTTIVGISLDETILIDKKRDID